MINVENQYADKQAFVTTRQALPAAPFPRKYVHCVFDNLQDAIQALPTLFLAGYNANDLYLMTGADVVEVLQQGHTPLGFLCSFDYDSYLHEAVQGRHILAVRLSSYEQIQQVRDLLAPHHARHMKYIDTWTSANLLP